MKPELLQENLEKLKIVDGEEVVKVYLYIVVIVIVILNVLSYHGRKNSTYFQKEKETGGSVAINIGT